MPTVSWAKYPFQVEEHVSIALEVAELMHASVLSRRCRTALIRTLIAE